MSLCNIELIIIVDNWRDRSNGRPISKLSSTRSGAKTFGYADLSFLQAGNLH